MKKGMKVFYDLFLVLIQSADQEEFKDIMNNYDEKREKFLPSFGKFKNGLSKIKLKKSI